MYGSPPVDLNSPIEAGFPQVEAVLLVRYLVPVVNMRRVISSHHHTSPTRYYPGDKNSLSQIFGDLENIIITSVFSMPACRKSRKNF